MSHTYIEQFRKLWGSFNKNNEHLITEKIEDFILKVRIDTLMECRGLVGDDEDFKIQPDGEYHFSENQKTIGRNQQRESFRTTIDTLIKKETI